ncbi:protein-L-isoaspartate O-methyltransferase [Candidatus Amesbacteria bacterium RIFCSPHIGHO2_01_FULL_48_32]|uniref:Protein-L-isoaspartate O-methyltransferase n=1 Tax=Candidatus Amesbacteria bacterium RIFCSPLOWO2_01_FULL_48_25 TaxID=1797259 RepID=A0A1F4ZDG7_9BACT|nr:MAG: protein-L-isoaspartate O-methyltransferase [Candidatus Amesbacteria bacterium RIFCSPHIGHO2_01_FULL_48_32]OGD04351.1 MAG: protein-L-isoaspartate O-methyltransferase [Candidatus Amesbacteria bacterium RIFCSPLOWO2_01_FULL_48_25]HJZ06186.1 protein-L-isoaspartate(D-aspartate) O-methyltransferase [Patescibacteria group bacterium]
MKRMLDTVREYGVRDERVLAAMAEVDRRSFVPEEYGHLAYEDRPLPIGYGQTISQPYTVARMCELLIQKSKGKSQKYGRVLEIGTGSGYQTALLAKLFDKVYSVEVVPELARRAEFEIRNLKFENVKIKVGDGKEGWPRYAPYDGIIVAAMADEVPSELVNQLISGGRIVIPVKGEMMRGEKRDGKIIWEKLGSFSFVPLV